MRVMTEVWLGMAALAHIGPMAQDNADLLAHVQQLETQVATARAAACRAP